MKLIGQKITWRIDSIEEKEIEELAKIFKSETFSNLFICRIWAKIVINNGYRKQSPEIVIPVPSCEDIEKELWKEEEKCGFKPAYKTLALVIHSIVSKKGGKERQQNRAITFQGIANAMAEQWG